MMRQYRVIPHDREIAVMNFYADKVISDGTGWSCYLDGQFIGQVWSGWADLKIAQLPGQQEHALMRLEAA